MVHKYISACKQRTTTTIVNIKLVKIMCTKKNRKMYVKM